MRRVFSSLVFLAIMLLTVNSYGQEPRHNKFVDLTGTIGASQGTVAGAFVYNWKIGRKRKIEAGLGLRWTTYAGTKKDFLTAGPARKTRSYTTPFLIFFAGQEEQNFDTLTVQRPLTNSLNVSVNLGYNISTKWYAGFNIDLIGFSFGRKGSGILTSNGITVIDPNARPASFNVLLTGDHDKGTLNSEFFVKYQAYKRWGVKAVYQFIFVEYESDMKRQTFSDGSMNNRFRNKANNFGIGIAYQL